MMIEGQNGPREPFDMRLERAKEKAVGEISEAMRLANSGNAVPAGSRAAEEFEMRWALAEALYDSGMKPFRNPDPDMTQDERASLLNRTFERIEQVFMGDGFVRSQTARRLTSLLAESHGWR